MGRLEYICKACGKIFYSYSPKAKFCSLKCKREYSYKWIDLSLVKSMYESCMTQVEIAKELGTTQKVIFGLFKRNGYKCRIPSKRDQYGAKNSSWVGNMAVYATFHKRVEVARGIPKHCQVCGTNDIDKRYEWANVTGDYSDINSYVRMCVKCHRNFDKSDKGIRVNVKRRK